MSIYNEINAFCKVRNKGNCFSNGSNPTPRVEFLTNLLKKYGIKYELDIWEDEGSSWRPRRRKLKRKKEENSTSRRWSRLFNFDDFFGDEDFSFEEEFEEDDTPQEPNKYFNIILKGTSKRMVVAHHDVNNCNIDNANDNSASVINAIATKILMPELNVILLDGEEFGGIGSKRASKQIKEGKFGHIEWVLNYELSGKGGENFFIGHYPGNLFNHIQGLFDCPVYHTPFNDSVIFRQHGIDSCVINPVPEMPNGQKSKMFYNGKYLDTSILYHCHNAKDNLASISTKDMKDFVEKVAIKILK